MVKCLVSVAGLKKCVPSVSPKIVALDCSLGKCDVFHREVEASQQGRTLGQC